MAYDVVIAGAGPVGLMLACELSLAGIKVVVIERLTEPDLTIKAGVINRPTTDAFCRRGMLPELASAQKRRADHFKSFADGLARTRRDGRRPRFGRHFAGILVDWDLRDAADPDFADQGPAGSVTMVSQQDVERVLGDRAAALGVELRRGTELTGFVADLDGVLVHAGAHTIRARWLVGCDGGRSTVRKIAGFDFPGTGPEITGHQAVVDMVGAEALEPGWNHTGRGVYLYGPVPGRILTVEFDGPPADRDAPVTAEEVQASIRRITETDITVTRMDTATRFTDNARQATTYRRGRVLLAGDAAHVHSPFGGQGLDLGIGDAMNLGWKLAAEINGWAPPGLLDTYTAERHPIGARVLDWTRSQVALMRPEPNASALREVVSELMGTVAGATYFVKRLSGAWQRYDIPGDHPLVGRTAPDLTLSDGSWLSSHCGDGKALLLDLTNDTGVRACADSYSGRVRVLTIGCHGRPDLAGLLLRPDGYVVWADDRPAAADTLRDTLRTWFGLPIPVPAGPALARPSGASGHRLRINAGLPRSPGRGP
jgi:2-polyprenyl-6-methoxyphenol hydroxylase-like FAD-dependent oxidoreductase